MHSDTNTLKHTRESRMINAAVRQCAWTEFCTHYAHTHTDIAIDSVAHRARRASLLLLLCVACAHASA